MQVKCRFCQSNIEKSTAYAYECGKNKHFYYCNEEHYKLRIAFEEQERLKKEEEKHKKQLAADERRKQRLEQQVQASNDKERYKIEKDAVYDTICDIFGYSIQDNTLFTEWAKWNKLGDNKKIKCYLDDNKDKLLRAISKIEGENKKIRYFSGILKKELYEFKQKVEEKEVIKTADYTFYDVSDISYNAPARRGLEEIEDEL